VITICRRATCSRFGSVQATRADTQIASIGLNTFTADTCLGPFTNEVTVLTKQ
jgi:hypothetical protein